MQNRIAVSIGGLETQTNKAIAGLQLHGGPLNITAVTHAGLTAELNLLKSVRNGCIVARTELAVRRINYQQLLKDARRQVTVAREALKSHLGSVHSQAWIETGFLSDFVVPNTLDGMTPLLGAMAAYLTAHPERENEPLGVEAANFTLLANDLTAANVAIDAQKAMVAAAMTTRDEKAGVLRGLIVKLLKALSMVLDPMDDRYLAFGFNRPGQLVTPDMPDGVEAILVGNNAISLKWAKAARAKYYRIWKKVVGADPELIAVGSPADLDFTIEGLPANKAIEIAISAVNNGGESGKTEIITIHTNP